MLPEIINVTADLENVESGSQCEFTGLGGSLIGHLMGHRDLSEQFTDEQKWQKKPSDDEKEPESILAKHVADALVNDLCYDENASEWLNQENGLWTPVSEKKALKRIMQVMDAGLPNGYAICKLNNIKSFLMIYLLADSWTNSRHLLPMKNGVLNTETMQLCNYSDEHRFNWQLPYAFNPDAKLNIIKRWLWDASGQDMEAVNIIRAFFKMALIGGEVQKFLELIGAGGTGKSTLVRLLVAFIGDKNSVTTDLKQLESNRFEAAGLYGKRLAIINDSSRYGGEVSTLKALTGGDPVRLEKKNVQQSGSFVFVGVVVIASNEAIQTADYTSGLGRRRMPVNFNRRVTDADKIKWAEVGGIETVMHAELPGLLNWAMAMPDAEVKSVIGGINGQMTQTQRDHFIETNKIGAWIDDCLVIDKDAIVYVGLSLKNKADAFEINQAKRDRLYANYESWCADNTSHPVAPNRFTTSLLDVCGLLKIDVIALAKDRRGKPIKGFAIRGQQHNTHATPITKKLLSDPLLPDYDPCVTHQTPVNSPCDHQYPTILPATITTLFDDVERF